MVVKAINKALSGDFREALMTQYFGIPLMVLLVGYFIVWRMNYFNIRTRIKDLLRNMGIAVGGN